MEAVSWTRRNITHDVETSTTYTSRTQIASEGEGGAEGRVEDRELRLDRVEKMTLFRCLCTTILMARRCDEKTIIYRCLCTTILEIRQLHPEEKSTVLSQFFEGTLFPMHSVDHR
mgnify:CR=1 FL=1